MQIPEEYIKAGKIASKVRNEIRDKIRVGTSFLEIAETVEGLIRANGGEPAFPCNVCVNSVAAHYTPTLNDRSVVEDGALLKVDIGVHINGFLVDTAITISFNPEYDAMTVAAENILLEAIRIVHKDIRAGEIGKFISSATSRMGFQIIKNLSGHMVEPYNVHAGVSIPNIWAAGTQELKAGQVYAMEPFLTSQEGAGLVVESKTRNIYSLISRKKTGEKILDEFVETIWTKFRTLPFTPRFFPKANQDLLYSMLYRLMQLKVVRSYPILIEAKDKPVAQAEHTISLTDEGVTVLT